MSRRGENIYRRKDGRWEGRYVISRNSQGRVHLGYVYGKTYGQVKAKLKDAIIASEKSPKEAKSPSLQYQNILCRWLDVKANNVKQSTLSRYEYLVDHYISPSLGKYTLNEIDGQLIEKFTSNLLLCGRKNSKGGLATKTVNDILSIVKCSLEYAQDNGYSTSCNLKKLRIRERSKEMRVLTTQEQQKLQAYLMTDPDISKLGVLLSLYTGIRIGELCALRWKHIHIEQGTIEIHETMQRIRTASGSKKTQVIISSPKSKSSFRIIPLPKFLVDLLSPIAGNPKSFFLTGKDNAFVEPRVLQNRFKKYLQECKLSDANYHSLRHTFATRCVEIGFDIKTLSEILGHVNVNITLSKYVHSSIELKKNNMNKLDEIASLN